MTEFIKLKTKIGLEKEANCLFNGDDFTVKYIALGDANGVLYTPNEDQTGLKNERCRIEITEVINKSPEYTFIVDLPTKMDAFRILELGILDEVGDLLFVSQFDGTPTSSANSNIPKQIRIKSIVSLKQGLNVVLVDPSITTASIEYVKEELVKYQKLEEKGVSNGYAPLDENAIVPRKHLPLNTILFATNSGNITGGVGDLLIFEGSNINFKVGDGLGSNPKPIKATTAGGEQFELAHIEPYEIPSGTEGNRYLALKPDGEFVDVANFIHVAYGEPVAKVGSTIYCNPLDKKSYYSPEPATVPYEEIEVGGLLGGYSVTNGVVQSVFTAAYNDNGNPDNKVTISGLAMPSDKYIDLTLGISGTKYIAPSNGWVTLRKSCSASGQYVSLSILSVLLATKVFFATGNNSVCVYIPVKAGEAFTAEYDAGGATVLFRFIYAQGVK